MNPTNPCKHFCKTCFTSPVEKYTIPMRKILRFSTLRDLKTDAKNASLRNGWRRDFIFHIYVFRCDSLFSRAGNATRYGFPGCSPHNRLGRILSVCRSHRTVSSVSSEVRSCGCRNFSFGGSYIHRCGLHPINRIDSMTSLQDGVPCPARLCSNCEAKNIHRNCGGELLHRTTEKSQNLKTHQKRQYILILQGMAVDATGM